MGLFAKGLCYLIDQETKLLNKMNTGRSVELMTEDQRMAREQKGELERRLWAKEEEIAAIKEDCDEQLQAARDLAEKKDREIKDKEKALKWEIKRREEAAYINEKNIKNKIWVEANTSDSVKKTLEYYTDFSKRTWTVFEEKASGKQVVLFSGGGYERYYDRYGKGDELLIDTARESWASIQEYLECVGIADKVMLLLDKDWRMTAYCLVLMGCKMEDIFVYGLMGYDDYEHRMLNTVWEELTAAVQDTQLVLVTANERAGEFIDQFGGQLNICGVLSAKKREWGQEFKGLTIVPVKEAPKVFPPEKTTLLLCSVNWNEYANMFAGWGYERVYSLRLLSRSAVNQDSLYSQSFSDILGIVGPPPVRSTQLKKIEQVKAILADEDSVITLENLLLFRATRADRHAFIAEDQVKVVDPPYFTRSFIPLSDKETYLDIGIGDGQTIKDFIRRVHGRYKKIYGWEIVPDYVEKAKMAFCDERIEIVPYGAWDEVKTMYISGDGMASSVSAQGGTEVRCMRIDDVCQGPVTFIKMDIEGAEMRALQGARRTIAEYRPKLAISLYHRQDDIWEMPLWIHELVPEYKLYIRHHKATPNDTVLYAVI